MQMPDAAERLHTRQYTVDAYALPGKRLFLRGRLEDTRCDAFTTLGDKPMQPGETLHGMLCEMIIDLGTMEILEVDGAMPHTPHNMCPDWMPALASLRGERIGAGFNRAIRETMGGPLGCAHFRSLVTAMAPVAMQGRSAARIREQPDPQGGKRTRPPLALSMLNTCHVFTEEGPVVQEWRARLAQAGALPPD